MYYIGLDVHKKTISYCVKDAAGHVHREGKIGSTRRELDAWIPTLPQPRTIAMEATIFSGWIYDHLRPHAVAIKVAHPLMLRAIALAKKKNDKMDASKIADCLRCDFLPECHMASTEIRDRRRILRYRHLIVRQMVQTKNRVSGLLLETGVEHTKSRLHKVGYFRRLMTTNSEIDESIRPLLRISRENTYCRLYGHNPGFAASRRLAGVFLSERNKIVCVYCSEGLQCSGTSCCCPLSCRCPALAKPMPMPARRETCSSSKLRCPEEPPTSASSTRLEQAHNAVPTLGA
jgi:hypothetical protein